VARIAAQMGHGDEDLARIRHRQPTGGTSPPRCFQPGVTNPGGTRTKVDKVVATGRHRDSGFIHIERDTVTSAAQHAA